MATGFPKIEVTDLLWQAAHRPEAPVVGREEEISRVAHVVARQRFNNLLLIGSGGVGKTAFLSGFIQTVHRKHFRHLPSLAYVGLRASQLHELLTGSDNRAALIERVAYAFSQLPACVAVLDQADALLNGLQAGEFEQVFASFLKNGRRRLVLVVNQATADQLRAESSVAMSHFETLNLEELHEQQCLAILEQQAPTIAGRYGIKLTRDALSAINTYAQQFTTDRALPDRALRFFDEVASAAALAGAREVDRAQVRTVFARRVGLPSPEKNTDSQQRVRDLHTTLGAHVLGQNAAVQLVAQTIQSTWLGLRNPDQPFGSFLFLGPSGVGKTEMAKIIAEQVYGHSRFMLRLDMSEFSEAHTVHRLLGAPPGYVGYEAGGQLTDFVRRQPFSLILLDEIEKAHPSLFDIFLQVLDDGRLTDGHGNTVDFTKTIIIATSNIGSREIVAGARQSQLMPLLLQRFRPEFLNRFSGLAVFEPLSPAVLLQIARLELHKIQQRLGDRGVALEVSDEWLQEKIALHADPLFGARPLKRFLEQTCEALVTQELLKAST